MKLKYVMFEDNTFVILHPVMYHSDVLRMRKDVKTAGFIYLSDEIYTTGKSTSLKLDSDEKDAEIILRAGNF
jgi:hypothetical protein